MNHKQFESLLVDYALELLEPGHRLSLEEHLAGCAECREMLAFVVDLKEQIDRYGETLISGHPPSEELVDFALGDLACTPQRSAELNLHLKACEHCREDSERVRRAIAKQNRMSRPGRLRSWTHVAVLGAILLFAWMALYFGSDIKTVAVLDLPPEVEARSGEIPLLALSSSDEELPVAVDYDPRSGGGDRSLLVSVVSLPDLKQIWSKPALASELWSAGESKSRFDIPPSTLTSGSYEIRILDEASKETLFSSRFQLSYGGKGKETGGFSKALADGGAVLVGVTESFGEGEQEGLAIRTNSEGETLWSLTFGSKGWDGIADVAVCQDGGFALTGWAGSAFAKLWFLKLDEEGSIVAENRFGTERGWDNGRKIIETRDGGFLLTGYTCSYGPGPYAAMLVRVNEQGDCIWQKTFGGEGNEVGIDLLESRDGGYYLLSSTTSKGAGLMDCWLLRLDESGEVLWDRTIGSEGKDYPRRLLEAPDGQLLLVGNTEPVETFSEYAWISKLSTDGEEIWKRDYPLGEFAQFVDACYSSEGGLFVAGVIAESRASETDYWLLSLASDGTVLWDRRFGGPKEEVLSSLNETVDGGFLLSGTTRSWGSGETDLWLVKTDPEGHWDPDGCPGIEGPACWQGVYAMEE
ncbi:MAG: zf-HC2 domain-containing protein [Candidatus Krumholzibacteria bacterium]|nr:zf-HC2 domain-containing protein [Candidatus Krumholzibacteria bacterium]